MTKCWYMVTEKRGEVGLAGLFYADTAAVVEVRLHELGQTGVVTPLSERGLYELVGHHLNDPHLPSDLATGPIILHWDGRLITVHG